MAYSELIKNLDSVRDYMRQFYVYGFRSRSEYTAKSARSYDNERRRIESWLGDCMAFRQDTTGKNVFISVDSRNIESNPLYTAFKAKSFTPGDILFHFYILDLLSGGNAYTIHEITEAFDTYITSCEGSVCPDESSIRKKLKEYVSLGLLHCEKSGRELVYSRNEADVDLASWEDALRFFSEVDPLGVIGSYLIERLPEKESIFRFKHHYILHALDSEILCELLCAIKERRKVTLSVFRKRSGDQREHAVCPIAVFQSTQSGRQYLFCYHYSFKRPMFFRIDSILKVTTDAVEERYDALAAVCARERESIWGVSQQRSNQPNDHVELTVRVESGESYILDRLEREKRCGRIEVVDEKTFRFVADVSDATELFPWLRTFIGRIISFECSNPEVKAQFYSDLEAMQKLYGGETNAVS